MTPGQISARRPEVTREELLAALVPPPKFSHARFDNYLPDPAEPTQYAAQQNLREFAAAITLKRGWFNRKVEGRRGRYLDGGFGVGKTHLLAALWFEVDVPKAFGTFVEFTNLVGVLGFNQAVEELSKCRLICIDEFELDDPGDTVLMSTLLMRLVERGVWLAATSNTLPDRLGEERFAAEDFVREIQGLAAHFDSLRVDGEDYRHRGLPAAPPPASSEAIEFALSNLPPGVAVSTATIDDFDELSHALAQLHPSKYSALVRGIDVVGITDVRSITDQAVALRWVVLADRLYDQETPLLTSGVPLDQLFAPVLLSCGYRKKYRRAISRLVALSREGQRLLHG